MKRDYTDKFEVIDGHRAKKVSVSLTGRLNKCRGISPRFVAVQLEDLGKWQDNLFPPHRFGFIVLTTSAGITGHKEAR